MEIEIDNEFKSEILKENFDDIQEIPIVTSENLTYNQFFHRYMTTNTPVVISGIKVKTEISEKWFEGGELKLEELRNIIQDIDVPVANCSKQVYDAHEKVQMKFDEYIQHWKKRTESFYLKDFHMTQELPHIDFYNVPSYFSSDWLNEYLIDKNKDDYRFVYVGPKNTWWVTKHVALVNSK